MTVRWKLETISGPLETYAFEINPNAQESPLPNRRVTWNFNGPRLGWSGSRAGRTPERWSFSGVLRSQSQYDELIRWVGKRVKVRLTDDRGDAYTVRLLTFTPTQQAAARNIHAPFRMTYSVAALVYDIVEAT